MLACPNGCGGRREIRRHFGAYNAEPDRRESGESEGLRVASVSL